MVNYNEIQEIINNAIQDAKLQLTNEFEMALQDLELRIADCEDDIRNLQAFQDD